MTAIQEFSKRPSSSTTSSKSNPHHVTTPTTMSLADCLAISDVVISAVPSQSYKVSTKDLKDGCVCVNVAGEKNFEADVRERVSNTISMLLRLLIDQASIYVPSVGMMTIAMLQRNL
jgi:methylenetetrahydrofolate dehydrogenase (NAD+)